MTKKYTSYLTKFVQYFSTILLFAIIILLLTGQLRPFSLHNTMKQKSRIFFTFTNLDHRTDRLEEFLSEMNSHGLSRDMFHRVPGVRHRLPTLGASYAARNAFAKCVTFFGNNSDGICCHFDDDFMFLPPYAGNVSRVRDLFWTTILYAHFDLLLLAGNDLNNNVIVRYDRHFDRVFSMYGLGGLCGRSGFLRKRLIPNADEGIALQEAAFAVSGTWTSEYCFDMYVIKLYGDNLVLIVRPKPGKQRPSYSDIVGVNVSYQT